MSVPSQEPIKNAGTAAVPASSAVPVAPAVVAPAPVPVAPPPTVDLAEEISRRLAALPSAPATCEASVQPTAVRFPCQVLDYNLKGWHLDATVTPDQVVQGAMLMDRHGFAIDTITGVDWLAENQMEVVYDYFHPLVGLRVAIRTRIPRAEPELPTISKVFPGADWHERETHDFFGIRFAGHPNLTPLLLPEDADYHPLKKDFAA
jgi:NADH-quinone oxidoreductase subunit C